MSPIEPCCYRCECGVLCCGDRGDDCGHNDEPTCAECCPTCVAVEQDVAYGAWLRMGMIA